MVAITMQSCSDNTVKGQSEDNKYYTPNNGVNNNSNVNVVVQEKPVGLDLQALGGLAQKSKNAEDFEKQLNQSGGINNVDLDNDGNVDYLNVVEFGNNNNRGFSVVDYIKNTNGGVDTNEIANITFDKNQTTNQVTTNINGNTNIYGSQNNSYQTTNLLTELILFNYLFYPHPFYYLLPINTALRGTP